MSTKENTKEILLQKIQKLRKPLETWLEFYEINGTILNEDDLILNLIIKITNYREYSYKQNREFEKLLNKELTGKNEEHNDKNWNKIITIYHEKMPQVMELLGKTYEDHGFEENWNTLHNQSKNIIIEITNIKKLIEETTEIFESEKDIFKIIEDIMACLQSTRSIYDNIDNWFKIIINKHDEELQEKLQDNFKITQKIITTLEEKLLDRNNQIRDQQDQILDQTDRIRDQQDQILDQNDQIRDQQDQINRLQEQLQQYQIQSREWRNLALSLSNTIINCERHNIP
jgi:flagellar capping protein FliD